MRATHEPQARENRGARLRAPDSAASHEAPTRRINDHGHARSVDPRGDSRAVQCTFSIQNVVLCRRGNDGRPTGTCAPAHHHIFAADPALSSLSRRRSSLRKTCSRPARRKHGPHRCRDATPATYASSSRARALHGKSGGRATRGDRRPAHVHDGWQGRIVRRVPLYSHGDDGVAGSGCGYPSSRDSLSGTSRQHRPQQDSPVASGNASERKAIVRSSSVTVLKPSRRCRSAARSRIRFNTASVSARKRSCNALAIQSAVWREIAKTSPAIVLSFVRTWDAILVSRASAHPAMQA